jgi:uroporphyrinogen III methyltransferase/synthase
VRWRLAASLGADVVQAPAIAIEPVAQLPDLPAYDLVCVTSPNGVARLFELVRDARDLAGPRIAAIGPGTAAALRERGIEPDVVPERSVAEGLVQALGDGAVTRALIARGEAGRDVLPDALRERGVQVDILVLYQLSPNRWTTTRAAVLGAATRCSSASTVGRSSAAGGAERCATVRGCARSGPRRAGVARPRARTRSGGGDRRTDSSTRFWRRRCLVALLGRSAETA